MEKKVEWKAIPGNKYYEASTEGQIRSIDRYVLRVGQSIPVFWRGQIVKGSIKKDNGYVGAILHNDKVKKNALVHRLIAQTFIPNPGNLPYVNHINGVKHDNRVENLEWCTALQNTTHMLTVLNKRPNTKLSDQDVRRMVSLKGTYTGVQIAKMHNISSVYLSKIFCGERRQKALMDNEERDMEDSRFHK